LRQDTRIAAAYLLGNVARGEERIDSDMDLAILFYPGYCLTKLEQVQLGGLLSEYCGHEVDLGMLDSHNLVYTKEAVLGGRLIYCKDHKYCDLFVATALGLYAEFRFSRKEVEDAYAA